MVLVLFPSPHSFQVWSARISADNPAVTLSHLSADFHLIPFLTSHQCLLPSSHTNSLWFSELTTLFTSVLWHHLPHQVCLTHPFILISSPIFNFEAISEDSRPGLGIPFCTHLFLIFHLCPYMAHLLRLLSLCHAILSTWCVLSLLGQQNLPLPWRAHYLYSPPSLAASSPFTYCPHPIFPQSKGWMPSDSDSSYWSPLSPHTSEVTSWLAIPSIHDNYHIDISSWDALCLPDSSIQLPARPFHLKLKLSKYNSLASSSLPCHHPCWVNDHFCSIVAPVLNPRVFFDSLFSRPPPLNHPQICLQGL